MQIIINLFLIQLIAVILVDISGVVDSLNRGVAHWLGVSKVDIPMIGCSFCISHHLMLLYLLITWKFSLARYAVVLLLSTFTPVTGDVILTIRDLCEKIISVIQIFLSK